jgi:hypothetical protein
MTIKCILLIWVNPKINKFCVNLLFPLFRFGPWNLSRSTSGMKSGRKTASSTTWTTNLTRPAVCCRSFPPSGPRSNLTLLPYKIIVTKGLKSTVDSKPIEIVGIVWNRLFKIDPSATFTSPYPLLCPSPPTFQPFSVQYWMSLIQCSMSLTNFNTVFFVAVAADYGFTCLRRFMSVCCCCHGKRSKFLSRAQFDWAETWWIPLVGIPD